MGIYLVLLTIVAIISVIILLINKKQGIKFTLTVYIVLLFLFSGLRYHTGWDWEAYDYFFDELAKANIITLFHYNIFGYEPGFVFFTYISSVLNIPPFLFFSIITVSLIISSAHRYLGKYVFIFCLLYLYYGYFHNFSIVRQGVAAALFAYSIRFLILNNNKFYVVIMIGALFHISAIMLFAIPLLCRWSKKIPFTPIVLLSLITVLFPISEMIGLKAILSTVPALKNYLNNDTLSYKVGFSLKYVELLLIFYCFYDGRFVELMKKNFSEQNFYIFRSLILVELLIYSIFNDFSIFYERLSVYFEFSHAIAIAMIISAFKYRRVQFLLLMILLLIVFFRYYQLVNSPVRVQGEMSHLERFENYCSIFTKEACQR